MEKASSSERASISRAFGGIFAPLAQFPGANYARILPAQDVTASYLKPSQPEGREKIVVRSQTRQSVSTMKASSLPYNSALLLVDVEGNASTEKFSLREVGIMRTRIFTSGIQAARFLTGKERKSEQEAQCAVDLVVCHPRLSDMTALQWVDLIRAHPRLSQLPVLMITSAQKNTDILQGLHKHPFTALLMRPYAQDDLRKVLIKLHEEAPLPQKKSVMEQTHAFDALLQRFENCQTESGRAEFHFNEGFRCLQKQEWDAAIHALARAVTQLELKGEAELGLAAAWRAKEHMDKYHYHLYEAALTFARAQKWDKARTAYGRLMRTLPQAESPFLKSAEAFVRAQQCAAAAEALLAGRGLGPKELVSKRLARACLSTENPSRTAEALVQAMHQHALKNIVATLHEDVRALQKAHDVAVEKREKEKIRMEREARAWEARKKASQDVMQKYGIDDEDLHSLDELQELLNMDIDGLDDIDDIDDDFVNDIEPPTPQKKGLRGLFASKSTSNTAEGHDKAMSNAPDILESITDNAHADNILGKRGKKQSVKKSASAIEPLTEENAEARFFSAIPGLNDVATVMKVTWKLMKRADK